MNLSNPEARRALRSVVQAAVVLMLLALVWWLSERLQAPEALREIARWSLGIVGLGTFFYGLENTTRAFKLSAGRSGVSIEAGGEAEGD